MNYIFYTRTNEAEIVAFQERQKLSQPYPLPDPLGSLASAVIACARSQLQIYDKLRRNIPV